MKFGIILFPGSNCARDCYQTLNNIYEVSVDYICYQNPDITKYSCIILPGGFSYGDYLRPGAIARFSPIMKAVKDYAADGGLVLGICNGFQILLEAGLLPGALIKNEQLRFVCRCIELRVENALTPFTGECTKGELLNMPVAHAEGNYYLDDEGLEELKKNYQVVLRYASPSGETDQESNPNGSIDNIAAVASISGNVIGMMPHPERSVEKLLGNGSEDGKKIFQSVINYLQGGK